MGWSPEASHAPTPSVQSRGLGSGHFSCSSVWFIPTRGPSKDLTLWVHPWGKVASPTPPCPRSYQRVLIHVRPLHLLGRLARQHHGPAQHVEIFLEGTVGRGHESVPSSVLLPMRQHATRGRSHPTAARQWRCPHRGKGLGGGGPPQSHLGVDADGTDGRDLKIVTCKGRGGRGGPGWCSGTTAQGTLYPGVCLQPQLVLEAPSLFGVTLLE